MEFFATADINLTSDQLQRRLTIKSLPDYCAAVDAVLVDHGSTGEIYCLWGQFLVNREPINGGVRFSMPGCPNALAWTITTGHPPVEDKLTVHCTINRTTHEPDFLESIAYFIDALSQGLERWLRPPPAVDQP